MPEAIDQDILEVFISEAEELLLTWEEACLDLEEGWDQGPFDDLCRSAHNLKGSAQGTGLEEFGQFVHAVESLIERDVKEVGQLDQLAFTTLLSIQEFLLSWVKKLAEDPQFVPDGSAIINNWKDRSKAA